MKWFWIILVIIGIFSGYIISQETPTDRQENYEVHLQDSIIIPMVAASDDIGMIGNITLKIIPGNGRILFDSHPAIDTDMQYSMIISTAYAQQYTGKTLKNNDLIIDIDIPLETIGGDSSAAAMTIGIIALLEGKTVNDSIILTGTISPDGVIRRVGEVREKTITVRDAGYKIFLIPQGQSRIRGQAQTLQEYLNNTIEIREVATIQQAAEIMIKKK